MTTNAGPRICAEIPLYGGVAPEEEAARAYDAAALEHFGEFARLNFPAERTA